MLLSYKDPIAKRKKLRQGLLSKELLRFPGAFSPLVAMMIEGLGYEGVYVSGATLSNDLGLPDVGLTTLSEVSLRGHQIARSTVLPTLIDIDTGFGEPMNVARTVETLVEQGLSGCHLEDQQNPKRCGHLDHKTLVDLETMTRKLRVAKKVRDQTDKNFILAARTDARSSEGITKAIERAKRYVEAGADLIFPESLESKQEFFEFRKALSDTPMMANMTEFGKSPLLDARELSEMGYNLVIYPVTALRLSMKAVEEGLTEIKKKGHQRDLLSKMQERKELYKILRYEEYNEFDKGVYNFTLD